MNNKVENTIQLDETKMPKHIAIIMDGNGRWAKQRGKNRIFGHQSAILAVKESIEATIECKIKYLTLFAFSTENWKRSEIEVNALMGLLKSTISKELETIKKNNICINIIGNKDGLPKDIIRILNNVEEETKANTKLILSIALNYGSRDEITNAVRQIVSKVKKNIILENQIDQSLINHHLYTFNLPELDLLIRTSGEYRISNFLLWQIAYAELYFLDLMWPDFNKEEFRKVLLNYQKRSRRFGKEE